MPVVQEENPDSAINNIRTNYIVVNEWLKIAVDIPHRGLQEIEARESVHGHIKSFVGQIPRNLDTKMVSGCAKKVAREQTANDQTAACSILVWEVGS